MYLLGVRTPFRSFLLIRTLSRPFGRSGSRDFDRRGFNARPLEAAFSSNIGYMTHKQHVMFYTPTTKKETENLAIFQIIWRHRRGKLGISPFQFLGKVNSSP